MKIKLVQDSLIFISDVKKQQYEMLYKHDPEATTLYTYDGNKKIPVCSAAFSNVGSVNTNGIVFDSTTDDGNMCITLIGHEGYAEHVDTVEKTKLVLEKYGNIIMRFRQLEQQMFEHLDELEIIFEAAKESIEVLTLG